MGTDERAAFAARIASHPEAVIGLAALDRLDANIVIDEYGRAALDAVIEGARTAIERTGARAFRVSSNEFGILGSGRPEGLHALLHVALRRPVRVAVGGEAVAIMSPWLVAALPPDPARPVEATLRALDRAIGERLRAARGGEQSPARTDTAADPR